ncbi:type IV pilus assembly protein PilA [Luteimonas sp. J16]|jgi:type IV pilus assembly protein PilA|nr:type IV pilus assembly protein PilA [Luteimonas sp. J16]
MPQTARGAGPPPLPPRPSPPLRPAPPEDDTRLRGCLVAAAVVAVGGVVMAALLAAIAIPAYNDYRLRSEVARALADAASLKPRLEAFVRANGRCPGAGDPGFAAADMPGGPASRQVRIGDGAHGTCRIDVVLRGTPGGPLDGRRLRLEYDPGPAQWRCRGEVHDRHLPAHCRA